MPRPLDGRAGDDQHALCQTSSERREAGLVPTADSARARIRAGANAARLRQWSQQLRSDFVRLQRDEGSRKWAPPPRGVEPVEPRKGNGGRWMSFALALNWSRAPSSTSSVTAWALLGWYQAQEERGVTRADVAF